MFEGDEIDDRLQLLIEACKYGNTELAESLIVDESILFAELDVRSWFCFVLFESLTGRGNRVGGRLQEWTHGLCRDAATTWCHCNRGLFFECSARINRALTPRSLVWFSTSCM